MSSVIVIDGNIGSGKTSTLKLLEKNNENIDVFLENIEYFKPWLELYYKDMPKYALGFQMEVLLSHMKLIKKLKPNDKLKIVERSPLSCINIFGKYLLNTGILCKEEQNLCLRYNNNYGWNPKKIIYIKTDSKVCYDRILKRSRHGETSISKEYLEEINKLYDELYIGSKLYDVYIVDGNQSLDNVVAEIQKIIDKFSNN